MRDYSQFGEQAVIAKFFEERGRDRGRFLDIGAHDGVSCSNTLALAERGWGGVLVEPSPLAFTKLITSYADRPDIEFVCAGVSRRPGITPFYEGGGSFVGTFDEGHRDAWEGKQHVHYRKMWTYAITFEQLFELLPSPYHFISIDTEGTNISLLDDLLYSIEPESWELICVERDAKDDGKLRYLIDEYGLEVRAETEANTLLVQG
jgi:FkbM family methyltransferase